MLSVLDLPELLRSRLVSRTFQRASQAKSAWQWQHLRVESHELLAAIVPSSLAGLCRLTLNGRAYPASVNVDAALVALRPLSSLTSLRLVNLPQLTDAGVAHIRGFPTLKSIGLQNCLTLTADALFSLHSPSGLRDVDPDDGKLVNLQTLDLTKYRTLNSNGMLALSWLPHLRELNLRGCRELTDDAMSVINESLGCLQRLDLSFCPLLTDRAILNLATP